ncbi:pyridoxal-phosphate dependent enzyme [Streptomyces sp. GS7]|uniref:pyridoxal-phosphate dependent enzyme n=1 Tax=Streptomyces sp. GS7 TaxID=2692234 RepID=UPI001F2F6DB7
MLADHRPDQATSQQDNTVPGRSSPRPPTISSLTDEERRRGVVCASAGNHGQGVTFACSRLGIRGRVFVPSNTPRQKRERIEAFGGDAVELVVVGSTYDEASAAAHWNSEHTGAVYVHSFDDVRTIEGQGTVAREITRGGALPCARGPAPLLPCDVSPTAGCAAALPGRGSRQR